MRKIDRALFAAGGALIGAYFWSLAWPSLRMYFSSDDMMNLYVSWFYPRLAEANLVFWKPSQFGRPLASAWYRAIYHFAGFNPVPFHIADLVILAANAYLTYALCRRLSGSRETGAAGALIGCYNVRLGFLYFDTGYIYDVLCYFFYCAALLLYVRARQGKRALGPLEIAAFCGLYLCALNSKEMAVSLPAMLLAYELIYHREELRWRLRRWIPLLAAGGITLLFLAGRFWGQNAVAKLPGYQQVYTWRQFLFTSGHFLGDLAGMGNDLPTAWVLFLWALLGAIAWRSKLRPLRFAWWFLMITPLPLAFLAVPRGASQYYIPWLGWVLYAATLVVEMAASATRRLPWPQDTVARVRGSLLLLALVVCLHGYFKGAGVTNVSSEIADGPLNRSMAAQLHHIQPQLRHGSRLLFLNDPIRPDWWNMLFLVRLSYGDRTLEIDRIKQTDGPVGPRDMAAYDYVFDYRDGRFVEVTRR
jgi:hypothetical protein